MKKIFLLLTAIVVTSTMSHLAAQTTPDVLPQYPGGDAALMQFVAQNLDYPEQAIKDKVEGNVFVEFTITAQGKVENAKILRSLSPECDAEVLRVVALMPQWTPARKNGQPVDAHFVMPISFKQQ